MPIFVSASKEKRWIKFGYGARSYWRGFGRGWCGKTEDYAPLLLFNESDTKPTAEVKSRRLLTTVNTRLSRRTL